MCHLMLEVIKKVNLILIEKINSFNSHLGGEIYVNDIIPVRVRQPAKEEYFDPNSIEANFREQTIKSGDEALKDELIIQ